MSDHGKEIWEIADRVRGNLPLELGSLVSACRNEGVPITLNDLAFIITRFDRFTNNFVPSGVASFIAKLVEPYGPRAILDPWAGMGFLPIPIYQALAPERYVAYVKDHSTFEIWAALQETHGIMVKQADALSALSTSEDTYDAVICCPPWGLHSAESVEVQIDGRKQRIKDDYGHLLMLESCRRLGRSGVAVFVVFGGFFTKSGRPGKARHAIEGLGFRVTSAIELPAGTFAPLTSITTHIVVLQRSNETTLFTGSFSIDGKHQESLLKNLRHRAEGRSASLGRLVPSGSFQGFTPIDLAERVQEQARRMGLVPYSFSDAVLALNAPASSGDFERLDEAPNAVYLPEMAATASTTTQEALPERLKSYFQLVLNPEVVDAEFLAGLLNSPFGQLWRDSLRTGETIPRIGRSLLESSTIYLPHPDARTLQERVVATARSIGTLRSELQELEQRLWSKPQSIDKIVSSLKNLNREERLDEWIDTLPFPLASILWVCLTQGGSESDRKLRMLQFFEALAEFMAVIHLSAFQGQSSLWSGVREKLSSLLKEGNLTIRHATFGVWTRIFEYLAAEARSIRHKDEESAFEVYKTRNRDVLDILTSKKIASLLQNANSIRNKKSGHTGAIGGIADRQAKEMLLGMIGKLREVFGTSWLSYELLIPGESRFKSGLFRYTVRKITGNRTPFPIDTIESSEVMEDENLYFKSPDERRGLKLLPLVKIMPSPRTEENACYFFSSEEGKGHRFLSYHYQAESEVTHSFEDVANALNGLSLDSGGKA